MELGTYLQTMMVTGITALATAWPLLQTCWKRPGKTPGSYIITSLVLRDRQEGDTVFSTDLHGPSC